MNFFQRSSVLDDLQIHFEIKLFFVRKLHFPILSPRERKIKQKYTLCVRGFFFFFFLFLAFVS